MGRRSSAAILVVSLLALLDASGLGLSRAAAQSQTVAPATLAKCWDPPPLNNLWDIVQTQASALFASAEVAESERPILALSSGDMDAAYSAGLLVGWGETGTRPEFAVVSGVGVSALIAPFAFLGQAGDQRLGDLFNCSVGSFKDLASAAAARLDETALASIASGHRSGRRLYLVTPSKDDRRSIVWDAGLIAASGDQKALAYLRSILAAAVDRRGLYSLGKFRLPRDSRRWMTTAWA